jgi:hypothetical protein
MPGNVVHCRVRVLPRRALMPMRFATTVRAVLAALPGAAVGAGWVLISALGASPQAARPTPYGSDPVFEEGDPVVGVVSYVFDVRTSTLVLASLGAVVAGALIALTISRRGRAGWAAATALLFAAAVASVLVLSRRTIAWDAVPLGWAAAMLLSLAVIYAFGALLVDLWETRRRDARGGGVAPPRLGTGRNHRTDGGADPGDELPATKFRWLTGWAVLATLPAAVVLAVWFNALFDGAVWDALVGLLGGDDQDDMPRRIVEIGLPEYGSGGPGVPIWWLLTLFLCGVAIATALGRWGWRAWLVSATVLAAFSGALGLALVMLPIDVTVSGHLSLVGALVLPLVFVALGSAIVDARRWRSRRREIHAA